MRVPLLQAAGERAQVWTWQDASGGFLRALEVEDNVMFIILSILVLIAAMNIVSGLIMLVKDKGKDIAILRTMGATRGAIMRIFLITGASTGFGFDAAKALAERGQIEIATSPYCHPILPLLLELDTAREAMPDVAMPRQRSYPGGRERVDWHIREGLQTFEQYFGHRPAGCWPSEGGVSLAALQALEEHGFTWAASGESVFRHSISASDNEAVADTSLYQAFSATPGELSCFFRDDGLSDLIGFTYSDWHADDAVGNLLQHLENIAVSTRGQDSPLVSIILDGENAWEYYPHNGHYFLDHLYLSLSNHKLINATTFSKLNEETKTHSLEKLCAGSWVYGSFSTWIGEADKNLAWDMLVEAKQAYDAVIGRNVLTAEEERLATQQLAVCEGSDWFWWFGDYNSPESVSDFEQLFRRQLRSLYRLLHLPEPPVLDEPVSAGGSKGAVNAGTMRRN